MSVLFSILYLLLLTVLVIIIIITLSFCFFVSIKKSWDHYNVVQTLHMDCQLVLINDQESFSHFTWIVNLDLSMAKNHSHKVTWIATSTLPPHSSYK